MTVDQVNAYPQLMQPPGWAVSEATDTLGADAPWVEVHALAWELVNDA